MVWLDYQLPRELPAEYGRIWAEYKCGKNKDAKLESVQTEVFNQKQAQATWIALDCRSLTRLDRW